MSSITAVICHQVCFKVLTLNFCLTSNCASSTHQRSAVNTFSEPNSSFLKYTLRVSNSLEKGETVMFLSPVFIDTASERFQNLFFQEGCILGFLSIRAQGEINEKSYRSCSEKSSVKHLSRTESEKGESLLPVLGTSTVKVANSSAQNFLFERFPPQHLKLRWKKTEERIAVIFQLIPSL